MEHGKPVQRYSAGINQSASDVETLCLLSGKNKYRYKAYFSTCRIRLL